MPSDLSGLSAIDSRTAPVGPGRASVDGPTTALTRIEPVAPQAPSADPRSPLGRSGLDLLDLLTTTDMVASRPATGPVALEVGLEQARGALLRNLPGDSLAALDGVWERARRTEEGWYLRSGALTVMGLPGESDRVAGEGLTARPESAALRFLQSLARLAVGDVSGARASLQPALGAAPDDPVLLAQHALVLGRQGDRPGADAIFARIAASEPQHPALQWARQSLRSVEAEATRLRSRPTPSDWPTAVDDIFPSIDPGAGDNPSTSPERGTFDVTSSALERFGARVALRPAAEVGREARMLMRAFSAGGTLATAVSGEQAHAARVVLATFLGVVSGDGADAPAPVRSMIEQLMPLIQQGRSEEAERLVRRQSALAREPIGRLLLSVIRGSSAGSPHEHDAAPGLTPAFGAPVIRGEVDRGPVVPVRIGLALLDETPAMRATLDPSAANTLLVGSMARPTTGLPGDTLPGSGSMSAIHSAEVDGLGWGAARAASAEPRSEWAHGAGFRAVALVCVALAMTALVTGHGAIAIGLAVGAAWLALRRSGRDAATRQTTSPPREQ